MSKDRAISEQLIWKDVLVGVAKLTCWNSPEGVRKMKNLSIVCLHAETWAQDIPSIKQEC